MFLSNHREKILGEKRNLMAETVAFAGRRTLGEGCSGMLIGSSKSYEVFIIS